MGVYLIITHFSVLLHFMQLFVFLLYYTIWKTLKKKNPGPSYRTPLKHPLRACVLHLIRDDIKSIHPFVKAIGTGYPHSFIIEFLEREARAGYRPTSSAISLKVAKDSCSSPSKHRNQWTECYLPLHSRFYHQFFPSPGFWQKKKKKKKSLWSKDKVETRPGPPKGSGAKLLPSSSLL